jgi:rare lipoprotein A
MQSVAAFGAASKKKVEMRLHSKKVEKKAPPKSSKSSKFSLQSIQSTLIGKGKACIYSNSLHGSATASGEKFNKDGLTAAHLDLPLGSNVRVTSLETGKSVVVRINDRGPFSKKYVLDMSPLAAQKIGLTFTKGTMNVKIEQLTPKLVRNEGSMAHLR